MPVAVIQHPNTARTKFSNVTAATTDNDFSSLHRCQFYKFSCFWLVAARKRSAGSQIEAPRGLAGRKSPRFNQGVARFQSAAALQVLHQEWHFYYHTALNNQLVIVQHLINVTTPLSYLYSVCAPRRQVKRGHFAAGWFKLPRLAGFVPHYLAGSTLS